MTLTESFFRAPSSEWEPYLLENKEIRKFKRIKKTTTRGEVVEGLRGPWGRRRQ